MVGPDMTLDCRPRFTDAHDEDPMCDMCAGISNPENVCNEKNGGGKDIFGGEQRGSVVHKIVKGSDSDVCRTDALHKQPTAGRKQEKGAEWR